VVSKKDKRLGDKGLVGGSVVQCTPYVNQGVYDGSFPQRKLSELPKGDKASQKKAGLFLKGQCVALG